MMLLSNCADFNFCMLARAIGNGEVDSSILSGSTSRSLSQDFIVEAIPAHCPCGPQHDRSCHF